MNELDYIMAQLQAWALARATVHANELAAVRRDLEEQRVKASFLEARDKLRLSDIERARSAGQGQALKALLEEIAWVRVSETDPALDHLEGWARDTLKELGEEPREERTA